MGWDFGLEGVLFVVKENLKVKEIIYLGVIVLLFFLLEYDYYILINICINCLIDL